MTLMSCRRAEKLMPLYAAGDLPAGRRSRAVAAHVARCGACAALAAEFRASRDWTRAADAVPDFGDEFYEQLRAGVLDRVNRDTRPAAPSRVASFFPAMFAGRRLAYAASLALAACALALALYFGGGTGRPQRNDVAGTQPAGKVTTPPRPAHAGPTPDAGGRRPTPDAAPDEREAARPKLRRVGGGFKRTPTLRRTEPPHRAAPSPVLTASNNASQQDTTSPTPRAETASVARIEIQTADPDIRIIWLTPREGEGGDAPAPNKSDPNGLNLNR